MYIKVLGAEFLDRGPALNKRQRQLRLGSSEIRFTETPHPTPTPSSHFALETDDRDAMLTHLDELGIQHVWTLAASVSANLGGTPPDRGVREDTREQVELMREAHGLRWSRAIPPVASASSTS